MMIFLEDKKKLGGLIRLLMYLLRHDTSGTLQKDKDGFVKVDDLIKHPNIKEKDTVLDDIKTIISQNKEKGIKMFELKGSGASMKIKAFAKEDGPKASRRKSRRRSKKASRRKSRRRSKKASRRKSRRRSKKASRRKNSVSKIRYVRTARDLGDASLENENELHGGARKITRRRSKAHKTSRRKSRRSSKVHKSTRRKSRRRSKVHKSTRRKSRRRSKGRKTSRRKSRRRSRVKKTSRGRRKRKGNDEILVDLQLLGGSK